jgi:hypothetical protein
MTKTLVSILWVESSDWDILININPYKYLLQTIPINPLVDILPSMRRKPL